MPRISTSGLQIRWFEHERATPHTCSTSSRLVGALTKLLASIWIWDQLSAKELHDVRHVLSRPWEGVADADVDMDMECGAGPGQCTLVEFK